jgi:putative phosphoribosyl transferase
MINSSTSSNGSTSMKRFRDRTDAGRQLARELSAYANRPDVLVLGLPRGGVPVAFEVAKALNAPLDILLVRKLGVPGHEELAMGAVTVGGVRVLNHEVVQELGIPDEVIDEVAAAELQKLERHTLLYRDHRPPPDTKGRIVILVDDGLATGASMRAAVEALRHGRQRPARIVVAVPIAALEACEQLCNEADEIVCLVVPHPLRTISMWYEDFEPTLDQTVRGLLTRGYHASTPVPRTG